MFDNGQYCEALFVLKCEVLIKLESGANQLFIQGLWGKHEFAFFTYLQTGGATAT